MSHVVPRRRIVIFCITVGLAWLALAAPTFAQRTDARHSRTAIKHLEEDPDYLKKLPKVIWRRPMGPYVKDVWSGYHGGPGPAKMTCRKTERQLKIMGANFLLVWDDCRGGELSQVFLFDGGVWGHVNCTMAYLGRDTIPRYAIQRRKDFHGSSPVYYLNQATGTKFNITRNDPDRVDFTTENRMVTLNRDPGPWIVRQRYRVYPQGVIVCDFEIELDGKEGSFGLRHAQMGAYLEDVLFKELYVAYPVHFRWGTCDYGKAAASNPNWKKLQEDRMTPMGSASFGVSRFAGFSNRFEFWLERPRPFFGRSAKRTGTRFEVFSSGLWYEPSDMSTRPSCGRAYEWELHKGDPVDITPPFVYRNRWVLAVGGPKVGRAGTGASRRNNLLGARIVHWNGKGYPADATLDNMAKLGADVLVLGRGWSKPNAPIEPADAARLKALVAKAHALKMRVILSVPLDAASKADGLFKDPLETNRDGLMIEGLGPVTMKPDDDPHAPAFDLAERIETLAGLRKLVGDAGVLIGRAGQGLPTQIEIAFLDAVTPGDDISPKLLRSPNALLTCDPACGGALSPVVRADDRRATATLAATPTVPQLLLESGEAAEVQSMLPLWKLLSRLDGPVVHALSPRLENNLDLQVEPAKTPVLAYLTDSKVLLIAANPSGKAKCRITLQQALGVAADASGKQLTLKDGEWVETPVRLAGGVLDVGELAPGEVRAYEFSRSPIKPRPTSGETPKP